MKQKYSKAGVRQRSNEKNSLRKAIIALNKIFPTRKKIQNIQRSTDWTIDWTWRWQGEKVLISGRSFLNCGVKQTGIILEVTNDVLYDTDQIY